MFALLIIIALISGIYYYIYDFRELPLPIKLILPCIFIMGTCFLILIFGFITKELWTNPYLPH